MNLDRILSLVTPDVMVSTLLLGVVGHIHLSVVVLGNIQSKLEVLDAGVQALKTELKADVKDDVKKNGSSSVCVGRGSIAQPATPPQGGA